MFLCRVCVKTFFYKLLTLKHDFFSGATVFITEVKPSMRNAEPHKPWVVCGPDGTIHSAHCTCMAG